jgi:hypothetical protein
MGFRGWTNSKRTYTDETGRLVTAGARIASAAKLTIGDTSEPPDEDLGPAEMALWLDPTPGATRLMVKAKDSNGSVKTGSLDLT